MVYYCHSPSLNGAKQQIPPPLGRATPPLSGRQRNIGRCRRTGVKPDSQGSDTLAFNLMREIGPSFNHSHPARTRHEVPRS